MINVLCSNKKTLTGVQRLELLFKEKLTDQNKIHPRKGFELLNVNATKITQEKSIYASTYQLYRIIQILFISKITWEFIIVTVHLTIKHFLVKRLYLD